jgi:hypothetical protein
MGLQYAAARRKVVERRRWSAYPTQVRSGTYSAAVGFVRVQVIAMGKSSLAEVRMEGI